MGLIMPFGDKTTETGNGFQLSTANWASETSIRRGVSFGLLVLRCVVVVLCIVPQQSIKIYIIIPGKKV